MAKLKVLEQKRALNVARKCMPVFIQEFESEFDIPCKINFGHEFSFNPRPHVYYYAWTDQEFYYVLYIFYHYHDWAKGIAKIWDEHRHDLEGCLVRTEYFLPHNKVHESYCSFSVFHKEFRKGVSLDRDDCIFIESRGHGITPIYDRTKIKKKNILTIGKPSMEHFDLTPTVWKAYQDAFNPNVHMPNQWSDHGKYMGWMWTKPDELFRI